MDRATVYPGQIPLETDVLRTNKFGMIAVAKLAAAMLGTSTVVNGLACVPTSPASLQVNVNPGEMYSLVNVDATAYSSLAADTTHSILKQGILLDAVTLSCPAPATGGQSINYLIQATYQDADTDNVALPYYNASNPSQAWSGPNNSGTPQSTTRKGAIVISAKAGTAATTGTQTTPAADSGYTGLWVVTVANGQSTITAGNITQATNAPILPADLLHAVQQSALTVASDTGSANTYVVSYSPAITSLTDGMVLWFKAKTANTGASTLNVNGLGAVPLVGGAHAALQSGEIVANGKCFVVYKADITSFVLIECTGGAMQVAPATQSQHAVRLGQIQTQAGTAFTTGGTAPAYTLTPSPAITSYAPGQRFRVNFNAVGTTGNNTLNINGLGAIGLAQYGPDGALIPAVIPGNLLTDVEYNGTYMVVLDPVSSGYAAQPTVTASVASNALTVSLASTSLSFRSATSSSGAVTALSIGNLSITVPSGASLGTTNGAVAQLAVLVAYNAGSPVLCVVNTNSGSLNLDEVGFVSPTTISGASNSAGVVYSASTVAANSPYRVVGFLSVTEATAGTWATAPSVVQGLGGMAIADLLGVTAPFGSSLAANGYQKLPGGLIMQWGSISFAVGTTTVTTTVNYPISFGAGAFAFFVSLAGDINGSASPIVSFGGQPATATQANLYAVRSAGSATETFYWFAIGR